MTNAPDRDRPTDWHREDIKAAVRKTGVSFYTFSRRNGFHPHALRVTLDQPWRRGQQIIADQIGVPPQVIWPSRYDEAGRPLRGLRAAFEKDKARRRAAHSQMAGVA